MVESQDKLRWGATLCAHAVEGADFNADWWRWEQRPAHIQGGATSEVAVDHLNRYKTDIGLAQRFGLNTLQYGISWARIEPEKGQFDEAALTHYEAVFRDMGSRGILPICVLQEHSLPAWFSQMGAWEHPESSDCFLAFVTRVYEALGVHCNDWIPHFEPQLWIAMAYGEEYWPSPLRHKRRSAALAGLAGAHQKVWAFLKSRDAMNRVGLSLYIPRLYPSDPHSPWDERLAVRTTHQLSSVYPQLLAKTNGGELPCCFIALSCPGSLGVHVAPLRPHNGFAAFESAPGETRALDGATPEAASVALCAQQLSEWGLPLLITGIGVATADDAVRCRHLLDHVDAFLRLRTEGLDMMGFCYRALLDGFTWHHGYSQRYGLIHVDRKSLARTPNPSAFLYQDIVKAGAIRPGAVSRFASGWNAPLQEVCG